MKVQFTDEAKRIVTVSEMPAVREILADFKSSDDTDKEYAEMAARHIADTNCIRIIESNAQIAKNSRVYDYYCEGSGNIDVWIEFTAYVEDFDPYFLMVGAYLSDIWSLSAGHIEEFDRVPISHMYIRKFAYVPRDRK